MNQRTKHLLTLILSLMCAAYSSAQVVIGDKNKYKIYFEERTVCLTDTIIRVRMTYECSVANGQMKNVNVTFEEISAVHTPDISYTESHNVNKKHIGRVSVVANGFKANPEIKNCNASTKNVGGISMVTSCCKVYGLSARHDGKAINKIGENETVVAEAVIDVAHPEWSRLQLRAVSMTQEQQAEYGKNLINPKFSKDPQWPALEFSPTTAHLSDSTYTMTPAIEYKKNDKGMMEYSIRLNIQDIAIFSIPITERNTPRLGNVNLIVTDIYPKAMKNTPKYKSIDEARKAMYDVVTVRALLDTRHPERSQISVDAGSVGFYGMGWHDQVVFLHGMGLM